MHCRQSADDRVIADLDVTGECSVVRENHLVANCAVVPDVRVGEEVSAAADARLSALRSCCD